MIEIDNAVWLKWLAETMQQRPGGDFVNSERGIEVANIMLDFERRNLSWRRSDPETFWVDVQLFVKYNLSNDDILFALKMQPGCDTYREHADERNAYAEYMRGLKKLKAINFKRYHNPK